MPAQSQVVVSGGFDDIKSRDLRFLEESAKLGELTVLLWPDETLKKLTGKAPKFPLAERRYFLNAVRYVSRVVEADGSASFDTLPKNLRGGHLGGCGSDGKLRARKICRRKQNYLPRFQGGRFERFSRAAADAVRARPEKSHRHRLLRLVSLRPRPFHEEVSAYGDLYVIIGHDANIRLLKGEGHPLLPQEERRYVVGSIKFVKQAL